MINPWRVAHLRLHSGHSLYDTGCFPGYWRVTVQRFPTFQCFPEMLGGAFSRPRMPSSYFPRVSTSFCVSSRECWDRVCEASELPCKNPHVKCRESMGRLCTAHCPHGKEERVNRSFCHHNPNPPQGTCPEATGVNRKRYHQNINWSQSRHSGSG